MVMGRLAKQLNRITLAFDDQFVRKGGSYANERGRSLEKHLKTSSFITDTGISQLQYHISPRLSLQDRNEHRLFPSFGLAMIAVAVISARPR